jgi:hypothetical protein
MTRKWKVVLLLFFSILVILISAAAYFRLQTKRHSPKDTVTINNNDVNIKVVYYQPSKKGRLVFGDAADGALQPFGVYWRLGANDATTIEVDTDISFAGEPLAAGIYSVYAFPGETTWRIGINSKSNRWGVTEPDHEHDVLMVEVPVSYSDQIIEQFKITLEASTRGAEMVLKWDSSVVRVPIE